MSIVIVISTVLCTAVGIVGVRLVRATMLGQAVALASGPRQAFIALAVLGFVMCALALPMRIAFGGEWWRWSSPLTITAIVLGATALLFVALTLLGVRFPFVDGYRQAILVLGGIIACKWCVGLAHLFVR